MNKCQKCGRIEDSGALHYCNRDDDSPSYSMKPVNVNEELTRLRAEVERLSKALRFQDERDGRIGTHSDDCYGYGYRHYECALRRIAELERWIPCSERLPDDRREVDVSGDGAVSIGFYSELCREWCSVRGDLQFLPTHWRERPEAPGK